MPALHFTVRWPDGATERCSSPSRSVAEFLEAGATYPLADFVQRSRSALELAGERVRMRYGFTCSSAADQLERIERAAAGYARQPEAHVHVLHIEEA